MDGLGKSQTFEMVEVLRYESAVAHSGCYRIGMMLVVEDVPA